MYWLIRRAPQSATDTGWQILSAEDTTEYLAQPGNMVVVEFSQACAIEPALAAVVNGPIGADLMLQNDGQYRRIIDRHTGADVQLGHHVVPQVQSPYPYASPVFHAPRRSTARFTTGLILTILGGLMLLGRLASAAAGRSIAPDNAAEAAGALTATILLTVVPLVIGIVLLATSKRRT